MRSPGWPAGGPYWSASLSAVPSKTSVFSSGPFTVMEILEKGKVSGLGLPAWSVARRRERGDITYRQPERSSREWLQEAGDCGLHVVSTTNRELQATGSLHRVDLLAPGSQRCTRCEKSGEGSKASASGSYATDPIVAENVVYLRRGLRSNCASLRVESAKVGETTKVEDHLGDLKETNHAS